MASSTATVDICESYLVPKFLSILSNPDIKTIFMCGCGGGFDFTHSMLIYPELMRLQKTVLIGSGSFTNLYDIHGPSTILFQDDEFPDAIVKKVTMDTMAYDYYRPEIGLCCFLDEKYPDAAPHSIYAYNIHSFNAPTLRKFHQEMVDRHNVDAVILFDGGNDALMRGDEAGLGTPIEDAMSLGAVAGLQGVKSKILILAGFGADRFHDASDCDSLRAVAELTASGGFLGCVSMTPFSLQFYREAVDCIYSQQKFRSVITGTIMAAGDGHFGMDTIPEGYGLRERVRPGDLFLWPLMAMLWAFDVDHVYQRSIVIPLLENCTERACHKLHVKREELKAAKKILKVQNLPRHEAMSMDRRQSFSSFFGGVRDVFKGPSTHST